MRRIIIYFILFSQSLIVLYGENLENAFSYLKDNTLLLNITTNILDNKGETVWSTNLSKVTINGRSVKIKISGLHVLLIADITPYLHKNNKIFLVSQGEVWIGSSMSDTVRHYATIKSIPVNPGEKAFFFPLGVLETSDDTSYTIELEIQILIKPHLDKPSGDSK